MRTLITGFPGFIARRLVRKMLEDDPSLRVTALVEGRMADAARSAAEAIDAERIELVEGDIGERRLGLDDADYKRLAADVDVVHHLAAIYSLDVPLELAQRVNVDGTGNVLDFCRACKDFRKLEYVSTAYVAGQRTGTRLRARAGARPAVQEPLRVDQVPGRGVGPRAGRRRAVDDLPAGDRGRRLHAPARRRSSTGRTTSCARSRGRCACTAPIAQFGRAGAPFNVVPVDFVVDAIAALSGDRDADGETLHLVDPEPLTAAELTRRARARSTRAGSRGSGCPAKAVAQSLRFKAVREMFHGAPRESIVYLNHPVRFDTRRADVLLAQSRTALPALRRSTRPRWSASSGSTRKTRRCVPA